MMDYEALPLGFLSIDYDIALMGEDVLTSPVRAIQCITGLLEKSPKEAAFVLCLDKASRPICAGTLSYSGDQSTYINAKEVAQFAILTNACGVILIHNHPSNGRVMSDLKASKEDFEVTKNIADALSLFNINLMDHIIINCDYRKNSDGSYTRFPAYYSMRTNRKFLGIKKEALKFHLNVNPIFTGPDYIREHELQVQKKQRDISDALKENDSMKHECNNQERS